MKRANQQTSTALYTLSAGQGGEKTLLFRRSDQEECLLPRGGLLALGCFDGVHPGHRALLCAARQQAERLSLPFGVWSPVGAKRAGQLLPLEEKLRIFASLGVEFYIEEPFEEIRDLSPSSFFDSYLMKKYGARALACGENFTFGKGGAGKAHTLAALADEGGIPLFVVPLKMEGGEPISSNRVRACLMAGDLEGARRLLQQPYGFCAAVQRGRRVGRALGFPTANLPLPANAPLKLGVYALWVYFDGKRYPALANVGVHPTFEEASEPLLEAYLLKDPQADLYDRDLRVEFIRYLRPERAFSTPEELTAQIARDVEAVRTAVFAQEEC